MANYAFHDLSTIEQLGGRRFDIAYSKRFSLEIGSSFPAKE